MREVRYLTDDRDRDPEDRKELVMQHGGNGDVYVSVVDQGKCATSGVRLATSGGAANHAPDLVFGLMTAFNALYSKASADPEWAKSAGITATNN